MNRLKNSITYLAGSIDCCPNLGADWREYITPHLQELGVKVINPLNKPIVGFNFEGDMECRLGRKQWKTDGEYDRLSNYMKKIRSDDLRCVDKSDFLIVYLDMNIIFAGTSEEISLANRQKKPILIVCKQGKEHIPDWFYGMIPHELFFSTFDECIEYLNHINCDLDIDDLNRWVFFSL